MRTEVREGGQSHCMHICRAGDLASGRGRRMWRLLIQLPRTQRLVSGCAGSNGFEYKEKERTSSPALIPVIFCVSVESELSLKINGDGLNHRGPAPDPPRS